MVKLLSILFALLLLALLTACGGQTAAPTPTTAPPAAASTAVPTRPPTTAPAGAQTPAGATPTPTLVPLPQRTAAPVASPTSAAPSLPALDPRDAVIKSQRATLNAGPYRTNNVITATTGSLTMIGEVVPPDRYHIVTETAQGKTEIIVVENKTYQKTGDRWVVSPINAAALVRSLMNTMTAEFEKSISNAKLVGPEVLNGVPTLVYTYESSIVLDTSTVTSKVKLWVAVATGLPVRQEIDGEVGAIKSKTVQTIEYDPTIKIEAPPVN